MPDDDVDDAAESIGVPQNLELNPLSAVADAAEDQDDADLPESPRFDGSSNEPDTGFSSGH
jgi:hypothetical protein